MAVFRETKESEIESRNQLLQKTLRPFEIDYPIELEYPLVLTESNLTKSYATFIDDKMVAHTNLLERFIHLPSGDLIKIGLIGNVATHPDFQGKGLIRETLSNVENKEAKELGCKAVFLWSDLDKLYLKLGYSYFGHEKRFTFSKQIVTELSSSTNIIVENASTIT